MTVVELMKGGAGGGGVARLERAERELGLALSECGHWFRSDDHGVGLCCCRVSVARCEVAIVRLWAVAR